ncbi:MAG: hypothetical protein KDE27_29805 [Planctomycetes bacterium]|nr:hypothetical protein [Planctomycetota bacterium]
MAFRALTLTLLGGLLAAQDPVARNAAPLPFADSAGPAIRIWSKAELDTQELWFRRELKLDADIAEATLVFSCDNVATVFVNGEQVAHCDRWEDITIVDIARLLKKGDNTIAIHAVNEGSNAALAAWVSWRDAAGNIGGIVTDKQWRYSEREVNGWQQPGFDASRWTAANATLPTAYGQNTYGYPPQNRHYVNGLSAEADAIEAALRRFRSAASPAEAQQALDALDRAVMKARAEVWKRRDGDAGTAGDKNSDRKRRR